MGRVSRIRVGWAFEVVALCQRAVLKAHTSDLGAFVEAFELLAGRLPSAEGAAERVFLADRLRELTGRATRYWQSRLGNAPHTALLLAEVWRSGPMLEDPRSLLLQWLRRTVAGLHAVPHIAPATRVAFQLHASPKLDGSLNLDTLAASVGCSRSVLTRDFRKLLGQSVCEYRRTIRLRRAIVMLSSTDWPVAAIARLVGYRSTNNFYVALRCLTTLTPAAIRRASPAVLTDLIEGPAVNIGPTSILKQRPRRRSGAVRHES